MLRMNVTYGILLHHQILGNRWVYTLKKKKMEIVMYNINISAILICFVIFLCLENLLFP